MQNVWEVIQTIEINSRIYSYEENKTAIDIKIPNIINTGGFALKVQLSISDNLDHSKGKEYTISPHSSGSIVEVPWETYPFSESGSNLRLDISLNIGGKSATTIKFILLPKIPQKTQCPSFLATVGVPTLIYINPESQDFTHKLYINFFGEEDDWTLALDNVTNGSQYTPPEFLLQYIPNNKKSKSIPCKLDTYYGETYIGSSSNTFTYVGTDTQMASTINNTHNVIDINPKTVSLTNNNQMIVKGFSTGQYSLSSGDISYKYDAIFKKYIVLVDGRNNISTTSTSLSVPNINSSIYRQFIVDSRDYLSNTDYDVGDTSKLINYFVPLLEKINIERPVPISEEMQFDIKANYFNDKFGADGVQNTLTAKWKVKANNGSDSEWQNLNTQTPFNSFIYENTFNTPEGLTITKNNDGTITINGTTSSSSMIYLGSTGGMGSLEEIGISVEYISGDCSSSSYQLKCPAFGFSNSGTMDIDADKDYFEITTYNSASAEMSGLYLKTSSSEQTFTNLIIKIEVISEPRSILVGKKPFKVSNPLTEDGSWNYTFQYTFEFELSDKLTTQTIKKVVYSSVPIFSFWEDNNRNKYFEANQFLMCNNSHVVESGSNDRGTYIKYYDGTMICTVRKTFTNVSFSNTWGSLGTTGQTTLWLGYPPQQFIEYPNVIAQIGDTVNSAWVIGQHNVGPNNMGEVELARPDTGSGYTCTVVAYAMGRWK